MESSRWLKPLFDAEGMARTDRWAIEERGIPSLELMEAAGAELARVVEVLAQGPDAPRGPIRVVCGKGNNGGDGLVAARLLRQGGHRVDILLLWPAGELSPDARSNLERLSEGEGEPRFAHVDGTEVAAELSGSGVVVDAIFGTGFAAAPRGPAAVAIEAITAADAPVVACDVPSGVDASTGEVAGSAVGADHTVSFHAPKVGHYVAPGKWRAGRLETVPIGIPPGAPAEPVAFVVDRAVLELPPGRGSESTKFSSGEVLIVGGSRGMTGAPCMAAGAAIRAGAGYATVGCPGSLEPILEVKLTEVMTVGLDEVGGGLGAAAAAPILERAKRAACVVVGPGIGRAEHSARLVRELAPRIESPLLIDADGLNAIGTDLGMLRARTGPTVLTPHAGELGRLLGCDAGAISARRLAHARRAATEAGAVVVLKGDDTIVTDGERVAVNALDSPALATAGTGDVLSGVSAAMIARGMDPFEGACAAVFAHARAGRMAAAERGAESVIATDVIEALPRGLRP